MNRRNPSLFVVALTIAVSLLALTAYPNHQVAQTAACPGTYCVSLSATISIGGGAAMQPVLAAISTVQVVGAAIALFQGFAWLVAVGNKVPVSLLGAISHLRGLDSAPSPIHASTSSVFWLSIESISAGRLTAKMLRSPNILGAGRIWA